MTDFNNVQIELPKKVATNFGAEERSLRERRANFISSRDRVIRAINKDGGRYVEFSENEIGLLVCGVEYKGKLHFVFIDKDRQICCKHHGESYRLVRQIPPQLSVLNYIYTRQRSELKEYLENFFKENEEMKLITDIAIRAPKKRQNTDDKNRKSNDDKNGRRRDKKPKSKDNISDAK